MSARAAARAAVTVVVPVCAAWTPAERKRALRFIPRPERRDMLKAIRGARRTYRETGAIFGDTWDGFEHWMAQLGRMSREMEEAGKKPLEWPGLATGFATALKHHNVTVQPAGCP